ETLGPSAGPVQVGTRGTSGNGAPAASRRSVSGVRRPGIARPAAQISIRIMAQVGVARCPPDERGARGYLASAGGPSHGASLATVGARGQRVGWGGGAADAHRIGGEGGPLVAGRCAAFRFAALAGALEAGARP